MFMFRLLEIILEAQAKKLKLFFYGCCTGEMMVCLASAL
jgi:hypothetical protein